MFLITWLLGGTVPTKKTIKTYEYKSLPLSLFERLFLDKFWTALPGHLSALARSERDYTGRPCCA